MAVMSVNLAQNLSANTNRGPSGAIWADCNVTRFQEDPSRGMYFFDDFTVAGNAVMSSAYKNSIGQWTVYADAGGTLNDGLLEGGVLKLSSGTDLDQDVLFSTAGSFRMVTTSTLALNGKLWFEARVAKSSIASDILEFFVGLADSQLTSNIPAVNRLFSGTDDTLATTANIFGFHGKGDTNPADVAVAFELSGGTVNYPTNLSTIVNTATGANMVAQSGETGFVKLGFIFDPAAQTAIIGSSPTARQTSGATRKKLIRFFVNGIELPTFLSSDDVANATATQAFPTGFMSPIFGCAQHATKGSFLIDWIRVAQVANS